MKNQGLIISVSLFVLALAGFLIYWFFIRKKTDVLAGDPTKVKGGTGTLSTNTVVADQSVMELQKQMNTLLPASYTKLVVDGIYGPLTAAAVAYVAGMKKDGNLASSQIIKENGKDITIRTDDILKNTSVSLDFLAKANPQYLMVEGTKKAIDLLAELFKN